MGNASTAAKQRWNKAHYSIVKASLKKNLAEQFKAKCGENGASVAGTLAALMSEYCGMASPQTADGRKNAPSYDTRHKRRRAASAIASQLEDILRCENAYRAEIPPNMEEGVRAEASDCSVEKLGEALEALREAY